MIFVLGMMVGGLIAIIIYACVIVGSDTVEPKETILLVPKEEWAIIKEKITSGEVSKIMVGDVEFRKIEVTDGSSDN